MGGIERNIQRIKRFSITCTINDKGRLRRFHNGHEYVEIGGIKWATCNVGAEKPTDNGLYFQWGSIQGYTAEQVRNGEKRFIWHDCKYRINEYFTKYNDSDKKTTLELFDDAAAFNMGIGWRTPTRDEFQTLLYSTTNEWVTNYQGSGVNGRLFTDKKDNTKKLFFPAVGRCYNDSVNYVGEEGNYWSSLINIHYASYLCFYDGVNRLDYLTPRCRGFAVRGVVG